MDTYILLDLKDKLRKRFDILDDVDAESFPLALKRLWVYLTGHPFYSACIETLLKSTDQIAPKIEAGVDRLSFEANTELEFLGFAVRIINRLIENTDRFYDLVVLFVMRDRGNGGWEGAIGYLKKMYIRPVYYYIEEAISDRSLVLYLLNKYKHICEWFRKELLFNEYSSDTTKGEVILRRSLLEFLYTSGVEINVEPKSPSGIVDFINEQTSDDPLIADTKVYSGNKHILKEGTHQVLQYAMDYGKPAAYLVVYNVTDNFLTYELDGVEGETPYLISNNITLYIVTINIFTPTVSASKRKLTTVNFSSEYLLTE